MKGHSSPNQILVTGILFVILFTISNPVWAVDLNRRVVYVWDFITRDRDKNDLTRNLTEEFEEPLTKSGCFIVLERRKYDRLIAQIDNERAIAEIESISTTTLDSLKFYQANAVFFGEVYYDISNGEIKVTLTIQNFNGTKELWSTRFDMIHQHDANKREKAMRRLVKEICPSHDDGNKWKKRGRAFSKIGHSTGAVIFFASAVHFGDKTDEARGNIPPVLSQERVLAFGEYKRFQTREHCYYLTAANLVVTSLPFWFDLKNIKPRIGKWPLASFLFVGSTTFLTYAVISGEKADDIYDKLKTEYLRLSEDRVTYWGKYQKYLERERILYINAAIDLATAIEILLWYNRDDENGKGLHLYLDSKKSAKLSLNFRNDNWIYEPQIGIVLQKSF